MIHQGCDDKYNERTPGTGSVALIPQRPGATWMPLIRRRNTYGNLVHSKPVEPRAA